MRPTALIHKRFSQVVVDGLPYPADSSCGYNELALVREKYFIAFSRVVDLLVDGWKKMCVIVESPVIGARMAVADFPTPSQVQHTRSFGDEVVSDSRVEFARVVDVGLEEECLVGEGIPLGEDVVEVRFSFSADVGENGYVVGVCESLYVFRVCVAVFGVD